jgi:hypothetical protein
VVADGEPLEITKALAAAKDAENGDFQERCHSLAAFQATWINGSA